MTKRKKTTAGYMRENAKYKARYLALTKKGRDQRLKTLRSRKKNSTFRSVRNATRSGYWIYEYPKKKTNRKK